MSIIMDFALFKIFQGNEISVQVINVYLEKIM